MKPLKESVVNILEPDYGNTMKDATTNELYNAVSRAAFMKIGRNFATTATMTKEKNSVIYLQNF